VIAIVGLSHRTAPIEVRERFALTEEAQEVIVRAVAGESAFEGAVVLSTCNRTELFVCGRGAPPDPEAVRRLLARGATGSDLADAGAFYHHPGDAAVAHLFRVAASLDSLVVGEPQILGQLKEAHDRAERWGTLQGALRVAMRHAFQCAKRVRTETGIGAGLVSVSSVAVELAERIFGDLQSVRVLLLGAGEMGESAAKSLAGSAKSLAVCNRSFEKAADLASRFGALAVPWERLEQAITDADVVVVSTGAREPVVRADAVRRLLKARRGRPLFFVDVALPRNVEAAVHELDGAYVYDIDDLEAIVREGVEARRESVERAEHVVTEELAGYLRARKERAADPIIVALRERTRGVLRAELERSLKGRLKHLAGDDREALEAMLDASVNKVLHPIIARLKRAAVTPGEETIVDAASELFEEHAPPVPTPGARGGVVEVAGQPPLRVVRGA
jgi:glutamyl-tRNA reductase